MVMDCSKGLLQSVMTSSPWLVIVTASLLLEVIIATPQFQNTGKLDSTWDHINHENLGIVQEVTNLDYESSTSIKTTQIHDNSWTGRYHSEVVRYEVYSRGDMGFYGFMFRLQDDWEFDEQNYNIAQFIADFTDYPNSCDTYIPTTMVWIRGNKLYARTNGGPVCQPSDRIKHTFAEIADVSAGVWQKIVIQISWKSDNTGYFKLWFNGDKVKEMSDIPTTFNDDHPFQFRVGLYANGWHDDNGMVGNQGTRSIWFDEIGVGTTFADADPGQW